MIIHVCHVTGAQAPLAHGRTGGHTDSVAAMFCGSGRIRAAAAQASITEQQDRCILLAKELQIKSERVEAHHCSYTRDVTGNGRSSFRFTYMTASIPNCPDGLFCCFGSCKFAATSCADFSPKESLNPCVPFFQPAVHSSARATSIAILAFFSP